MSLTSELQNLKQLLDEGALSEREYTDAKRKVIDTFEGPASKIPGGRAHEEYDSLGHAANRYVNFNIVMAVAGALIALIVFFFVFRSNGEHESNQRPVHFNQPGNPMSPEFPSKPLGR